jgi:aspartate beta-hydroxylase
MTGSILRVQELLAAAAGARQRGAGSEELRLIEQALQLAPADPRACNARGMRALADQEYARARACFTAATDADPGEAALWMNLATANRRLADDAGERASLDQALAIDRLNFMAQLRLAELNQRSGQVAAAIEGWQGVLTMAQSMEGLRSDLSAALARGRQFVAERAAVLAAAIDHRVGEAWTSDPRGTSRFRACVDHALGRRAIYRNECAGVHFPFLPAVEFFERDQFPWLETLERRTAAIRDEALRLVENGIDLIRPYVRQEAGTPDNKWSALNKSLDWSACFLWEYGVRNDAVCALCPETAAALADVPQNIIPGKAPSAFFSLLKPQAHIPAHTGVTNTRAIIHLPLVVPDDCRFRVGGETREWRVGEALAFDDTIEHEAWNDSDALRIVLILDVWNPYLTELEQQLLSNLFEATEEN